MPGETIRLKPFREVGREDVIWKNQKNYDVFEGKQSTQDELAQKLARLALSVHRAYYWRVELKDSAQRGDYHKYAQLVGYVNVQESTSVVPQKIFKPDVMAVHWAETKLHGPDDPEVYSATYLFWDEKIGTRDYRELSEPDQLYYERDGRVKHLGHAISLLGSSRVTRENIDSWKRYALMGEIGIYRMNSWPRHVSTSVEEYAEMYGSRMEDCRSASDDIEEYRDHP